MHNLICARLKVDRVVFWNHVHSRQETGWEGGGGHGREHGHWEGDREGAGHKRCQGHHWLQVKH